MAELRIHSGADDDFLESYLWYANQSQLAAERFEEHVKLAFNKIAADPLGGTAYNETYRSIRCRTIHIWLSIELQPMLSRSSPFIIQAGMMLTGKRDNAWRLAFHGTRRT